MKKNLNRINQLIDKCAQDDPLSSLDNEVSKCIFDNGIRNMLSKHQRTIIMVTQKTNLVHSSDYVNIWLAMMRSQCWQQSQDKYLPVEFSFFSFSLSFSIFTLHHYRFHHFILFRHEPGQTGDAFVSSGKKFQLIAASAFSVCLCATMFVTQRLIRDDGDDIFNAGKWKMNCDCCNVRTQTVRSFRWKVMAFEQKAHTETSKTTTTNWFKNGIQ